MVFFSPPMINVTGCRLKRTAAMTPGTVRIRGTCSLSYTSLKSASFEGSTSIAALNRYRVWIGMVVFSFGLIRVTVESASALDSLVSRPRVDGKRGSNALSPDRWRPKIVPCVPLQSTLRCGHRQTLSGPASLSCWYGSFARRRSALREGPASQDPPGRLRRGGVALRQPTFRRRIPRRLARARLRRRAEHRRGGALG